MNREVTDAARRLARAIERMPVDMGDEDAADGLDAIDEAAEALLLELRRLDLVPPAL